ncbi:MAG: M48 family metalloprotease [Neomegalonema sp.]|nr:M48 family metalloprotease [Neomegalonema sp.]
MRLLTTLRRPANTRRTNGSVMRRFGRVVSTLSVCALPLIGTLAPTLSAARSLIRDAEIERTLKMFSAPIYKQAGLNHERAPIFMLNDSSLNAFVTGGNVMFLHTGMLLELDTPDELIAVIAHEAGHIVERHVITRIAAAGSARTTAIISSLVGIGAALAGGGRAGVAAASAGSHIALRDLLKFTRAQEAGADQRGVLLMTAAGIDPTAMLRVMKRFDEQTPLFGVNPYALTHPLGRARIVMLEEAVRKSGARGRKLPKEFYYWHARMRAKLDGFLATPGGSGGLRFGVPEFDLYREAIYLHRLPDPEGALKTVDKLIKIRPSDPYYWELKGQILYESGRGPEAVGPYRRAAKLAPREPLIAAGLGEALLTVEKPKTNAEALRVLEKAAIADPHSPGMRRSLAIAYARSGKEGMAAVVTAERFALVGRLGDARIHAERARRMLPTGSPGWLRAEDVLALKPR